MRAEEFDNPKEKFVEMFRKFLPLAMEIIGLKSLPRMVFEKEVESPDQPTFGQYVNNDHILHVGLANRHPNDILRTVAHELVHYKQDTEHKLNDMSGNTGSPEENEANALAGIVMRNFNKRYPEYLKVKPVIAEAWSEKYKRSINCSNPKGFSQRAHCQGRKKNESAGDRGNIPTGPGEQLIPFPKGTTMVDVSDVYDWYKLGMVISDLDDADPKIFGQGAPHTVIAFGSEEEEHKLLPLLKRLGLSVHDIDRPEDVKKVIPAKMLARDLAETIRKVKGGKFRLVSKKGRNLGTYPTRAGAEKRERQVQYFKHIGEVSTKDLSMLSESEATDRAIKILKGIGFAASQTAKGAKGVVDAISAFGQSVMNGFKYAAGLAVGVGVITHPKEMWNAANFAWNFVTNPGHVTAVLGRTGLGGIPVIGDKWVNKDQAAEDLRKIMGNSTTSDVIFKLADLAVDNAIPIAGIIALLYGGKTFVDYLKKHNAIDTEKQEPTDTAQKIEKDKSIKENNKSQYIAALYVDEFADGDHWYIKGTPDVIQRFVQLANSLEDEVVKGTEYEPGLGMMAKIHKDLGDDSIPQWKIVPATNLEQIKPITGASLRVLMTADLSDGAGEFMSDFLWNLEEKGQALVHDGSEQGVSESFDKEAEAWRDWQLKMLPRKIEMLSRLVKGWTPSKADHIAAIEAGYNAMKETGNVNDAAKAISDTFKEIQSQQGVTENFADGRNPQDKGDSARHGIRKGMTIAQLKKIRSSDSASPRKKQLAHWQINMRQGRKK